MQEVFEKIKQRIIIVATEAYGYTPMTRVVSEAELKEILEKVEEEYGDGWILCSEQLPPQPKENPVFDNKPLELYLVSNEISDYSFRAFWNGKFFTDGFGDVKAIAWQPLPPVFKAESEG